MFTVPLPASSQGQCKELPVSKSDSLVCVCGENLLAHSGWNFYVSLFHFSVYNISASAPSKQNLFTSSHHNFQAQLNIHIHFALSHWSISLGNSSRQQLSSRKKYPWVTSRQSVCSATEPPAPSSIPGTLGEASQALTEQGCPVYTSVWGIHGSAP